MRESNRSGCKRPDEVMLYTTTTTVLLFHLFVLVRMQIEGRFRLTLELLVSNKIILNDEKFQTPESKFLGSMQSDFYAALKVNL